MCECVLHIQGNLSTKATRPSDAWWPLKTGGPHVCRVALVCTKVA